MDWNEIFEVSRFVSEERKVWILLAGLVLVAAWNLVPKGLHRARLWVLVALTLMATLNYGRWGTDLISKKVDTYDLVHYYLNAKYFDELGYYDLYPAGMFADHSNGGPHFQEGYKYMAQNAAGHGMRPIEHGVERGKIVSEENFTPERWSQFEHDFLHIQRVIPGFSDKLYRQMIQDHGFNGTLPWVLVAKPLADVVPVEHIKLICYVDLVLLLVGVAFVYWGYGGVPALFCWFFLMTSYSVRWPTITWAYLRYDYVAALLMGMALLKKGKHLWAGVATGYAAVIRLFPAMWMYGPGAKGVAQLVRGKVNKKLVILAAGFFAGAIGVQGLSMAVYGAEPAKVHFENMMDHNSSEQLSSRRIGLALALPYRGEMEPKFIEPERKDTIEAQKPLRYGLALAIMALMGWGLRNARDDEAYALGFVPFFLLTTASYYYYVTRITLMVMHASDLKKSRNQIGLAMLVAMEMFSNFADTAHEGYRVFHIGWLAWLLSAYMVVMTIWFLIEARQKDEEADADTDADGAEAPAA